MRNDSNSLKSKNFSSSPQLLSFLKFRYATRLSGHIAPPEQQRWLYNFVKIVGTFSMSLLMRSCSVNGVEGVQRVIFPYASLSDHQLKQKI
jgi:hypothetical protein